ncbi:MAG: acyl-ACP--UDP-N-acetylglucosamine O-acyltransferase [Hyphomonadaceae bacterium]|nr:acyl-ACP--UDP-N-acetylglucosamine O-acyltransferase [Hyphomonadaceae bacterium]
MNEPRIHPSSVIHEGAEIGEGVEIGPFCEVGPQVVLGARVRLHGRVTIMGETILGEDCEVFPGAVLGCRGQSLGAKDEPGTGLVVGPRTVFREFSSVHAGLVHGRKITRIGSDCYFMTYAHAGHDCQIGNHCVFANAAEIGGHCLVGDHVWMGGVVAIHQFSEIGDHAFVAGGAIVVSDVIPFGIVAGNRAQLTGLNVKGMTRRGFSREDIRIIRRAYKMLFEGEGAFADRLEATVQAFQGAPHVTQVLDFIRKDRSRALCLPGNTG